MCIRDSVCRIRAATAGESVESFRSRSFVRSFVRFIFSLFNSFDAFNRSFLKQLGVFCFKVTATIEDARLSKGVRAAVYMKADDNSAHFVPEKRHIFYGEGHDMNMLSVLLYFKTEETAAAFSRALRKWSFDHPNSNVQPKVSLPAQCIRPIDLQPVIFDQYDPAEAKDSPCTSLADFKGFSITLVTEPAELTVRRRKTNRSRALRGYHPSGPISCI